CPRRLHSRSSGPFPPMIIAPASSHAPFGIYIHVPFCAHICPYCDFNTYAGKEDLIPRYVEAVVAELAMRAPELAGRQAETIYRGGGTPSLLSARQVAHILDACHAAYDTSAVTEV